MAQKNIADLATRFQTFVVFEDWEKAIETALEFPPEIGTAKLEVLCNILKGKSILQGDNSLIFLADKIKKITGKTYSFQQTALSK